MPPNRKKTKKPAPVAATKKPRKNQPVNKQEEEPAMDSDNNENVDISELKWDMSSEDMKKMMGVSLEFPLPGSVESDIKKSKIIALQRKLTLDLSRFNTGNYAAKRANLDRKLAKLTEGIWNRVPEMMVRGHYANFISHLMTYTELYNYAKFVYEKDYGHGKQSYIPCQLLDLFDDYFMTIDRCYKKGRANIADFSYMLLIRDRVVESFREHFTIGCPMLEMREIKTYTEDLPDRYQPYDYEWLSSSVVLGDYQVPFTKYLAASRINQMEITLKRAELVATHQDDDVDFIRRVRPPIPENANSAMNISKLVVNEETSVRTDFINCYNILRFSAGRIDTATNALLHLERFNEICGVVSRMKKKMIDEITYCENKYLKGRYRTIALLAQIDSLLLILQKVYAMYVDHKKGFYGIAVPELITTPLIELFRMAHEENFHKKEMNAIIQKQFDFVRNQMHYGIQVFFRKHEHHCRQFATVKPDVSEPEPQRRKLDVAPQNFPIEILQHVPRMFNVLNQQHAELDRLHIEKYKAKVAKANFDEYAIQRFRVNACKGCTSFYSNFNDVCTGSQSREAIETAKLEKQDIPPSKEIGRDIMIMANEVMERMEGVPHYVEINKALELEFCAELQGQRIRGKTYKTIALTFTEMLLMEITLSGIRTKYRKADTILVASEIAERLVDMYMDYVCKYSKNPPRRYRIKIDDDDRQGMVSSPEYLPESESEYATDEATDTREHPSNSDQHYIRVFNEVSNGPIEDISEDESSDDLNDDSSDVPDAIVNDFIDNVRRVVIWPDISDDLMNAPLD
uniref:RING-type domain-containing protein n=1 Tax=Caenorhabditis tropicalis TaxID=1561998 RepID=A0A1I7TJ88_9PELO